MKRKLKELNVDFIGGQGPLTKEEEQKISAYLKNQKRLSKQTDNKIDPVSKRKKTIV